MGKTLLKFVQCKRCNRIFYVCHSCWRGQIYCCAECRQAAQREAHCKRQQKYRQTKKGKEAHNRQEKNRRMREIQKTMDDTPSTSSDEHDSLPEKQLFHTPCCRFCGIQGQIVAEFPRRGYGGRYAEPISQPGYLKGG